MVDMSDIASMYSDIYASAADQTVNKLKDRLENADYSKATDDELMNACKQFEAYFVEQMYKGMLKTLPQGEETSNYTSTMMDFYKDQMVQGVAEMTVKQSDLGLAQMLYEQMKRNYDIADVPEEKGTDDTAAEETADADAAEKAEAVSP